MKVSSQLHAPAALALLRTEYIVAWALCRRELPLASVRHQTTNFRWSSPQSSHCIDWGIPSISGYETVFWRWKSQHATLPPWIPIVYVWKLWL